MAESSTEERTEKPTPKRLKELQKKNTVWRSPEFTQAAGLVAIIALAPTLILNTWNTGESTMRLAFGEAGSLTTISEVLNLTGQITMEFVYATAMPVLLVLVAVGFSSLVLTKGRPNAYAVKPQFAMLNPKQGVKKVFGVQGLIEACKGLVKLTAVAVVGWTILPRAYESLEEGPASIGDFLAVTGSYAWQLAWRLAAIAVLVAVFDLWWTKRRWGKQAKMSKSDVRRENKSSDGDPMLKAARRQRAIELSRRRMMDDVSSATVVLTNPTHLSVALRYGPDDFAPVVVARGAGVIALKIRERAAAAGIPVQENRPLARSLYRACRVGDAIPVELYTAVAAVLAAVMRKQRRKVR